MKNHSFSKLIGLYGIIFSFIFIFQMFWVLKHTYLDYQFKRLEKNYYKLQVDNQKILFEINRKSSKAFSEYNLSGFKKINIKNIPIIEFH